MAGVAVAAVIFSSVAAVQVQRKQTLAWKYAGRANFLRGQEIWFKDRVRRGENAVIGLRESIEAVRVGAGKTPHARGTEEILSDTLRRLAAHRRLVAHYAALEEKYAMAATRPWVPLTPDPPTPPIPTGGVSGF